jgi:phosphatidylglycerophosphate synthase
LQTTGIWINFIVSEAHSMTTRVEPISMFSAFAGVAAITGVTNSLSSYFPSVNAARFAAGGLATWLSLVVVLVRLRCEHAYLGPLSAATGVTLARGLLISLVAGFALGPAPIGPALWLPGVVYGLAALADRLDGALARRMGAVTALGAKLDVTTDAVGLLVAPLVGVRWGRLPPWYLALAFAYPLFRVALRLRRARGLAVFPERLRLDPRARFFAGVQMIVVAVALLPLLPRSVAWTVATLAMLPTVALFVGEWRLVTRSSPLVNDARLVPDGRARAEGLHAQGDVVPRAEGRETRQRGDAGARQSRAVNVECLERR